MKNVWVIKILFVVFFIIIYRRWKYLNRYGEISYFFKSSIFNFILVIIEDYIWVVIIIVKGIVNWEMGDVVINWRVCVLFIRIIIV